MGLSPECVGGFEAEVKSGFKFNEADLGVITWKFPTMMRPVAQIQAVESPAVLRTQFWCFSITWA